MSRSYTLLPSASMACRGTAFFYIYTYVCVCRVCCLYVCICAHMYVRTFVYACKYMYAILCDIYACVRTCVYMCMYICVCVCVCVCVYVWVRMSFFDVTTLSDSHSPFFSTHPQSCLLSPFCRFILDSLYRLCSTVFRFRVVSTA
jgi:hypothetical protein